MSNITTIIFCSVLRPFKWLVVNFSYIFMLQLIEYYLLIRNPVCDLKKSYLNSSNPVLKSGKLSEKINLKYANYGLCMLSVHRKIMLERKFIVKEKVLDIFCSQSTTKIVSNIFYLKC